MFTKGMNSRMTSHGLLPRAVQIFAHIITKMTMFTRGMSSRMIIHNSIFATRSSGMHCAMGIQMRSKNLPLKNPARLWMNAWRWSRC